MTDKIYYCKPFVIIEVTRRWKPSQLRILGRYDGDFKSMVQKWREKYPNASYKDFDAPYHGKNTKFSVPKDAKKFIYNRFKTEFRKEKLEQLLNE